mgnify:CR=1 FL=1
MIPTTPTRDAVRERYAAAARSHLTGDASPCCSGSRSGGEPDPITVGLYERTDSPSDAALAASLGCGNPTALADLSPGEDVLDLGSGGGLDVLLSARRVGPTGTATGLDMTDEMLELAASGAKVLHLRCVEYARRSNIPIHVRSSFSSKEGTWVLPPDAEGAEDMEEPIIAGVAHDSSEAKITVVGVPDQPGRAGQIFTTIAEAQVNIDMIVQNVSEADTGRTDISFTLPMSDGQVAVEALMRTKEEVGFESIQYDDQIGKLSLVGAGMRTNPGVSATFFKALADAGINIEMISTSEIRISVVTRADQLDDALRALHTAFDLDSDEGEAVVYAGTGR